MRIAIPTTNGILSAHFGHCEQFTVIDVNEETKKITNVEAFDPPAHEPGVLPRWLGGLCVNLVIAGGMGQRAQMLFNEAGVEVMVGAPSENPEKVVGDYLAGVLETGTNVCDH